MSRPLRMTRNGTIPVPELLAPAGSPEAFRAAVAAGADAVYLGGKRFGARAFAANFTDSGIEEATAYAHARNVKVYVTVNTLIHDRELRDAGEYLIRLYSAGVDAVLVQDMGLASLARDVVPGLPLHASTQMTIHNAEGVRAAAEMGFSRVVLARELTLDEIFLIAKETAETGVGLEVFAHGALCFSYSGQCLLSSLIGGRSGNRGMCAQPCRKPYTLVAGTTDDYGRPVNLRDVRQDGDYLISTKDLCTYPRLDRLVHSPIVSLKIEGRMKSPEYVAVVTAAYRRALDAIAGGGHPSDESAPDRLALAFNRGFTEGYLFNRRHSAVMGREQPDNRGLFIGTVERYRPKSGDMLVRTTGTIVPVPGDGLYITHPDRKAQGLGFSLNTTPGREGDRIVLPVPGRVRPGSCVFMTFSTSLAAETRRIIAGEYPDLRRPVPVDCEVRVDGSGFVTIDGNAGGLNGRLVPVHYRSDIPLDPARTRPLTAEKFSEHLKKTGGTPFAIRSMDMEYDGTLFAPASTLNRMRREFLAGAEAALIASCRPETPVVTGAKERLAAALPEPGPVRSESEPVLPELVVWTGSSEGVQAAAGEGCDRICFQPDIQSPDNRCGTAQQDTEVQVRSALVTCRQAGIPLVWALPRITRQAELGWILAVLPVLHKEGLTGCMADGPGAILAVRSGCPGIAIHGSSGLNVFNYRSAQAFSSSCSSLILSPELAGPEIAELIRRTRATGCGVEFGLVVEGTVTAMVAENCLLEPVLLCRNSTDEAGNAGFYGLRDSTGRIFTVTADGSCRTHIGNADETCLIDHLPEILAAGVRTIIVDARGRPAPYVHGIVRIYREALRIVSGENRDAAAALLRLKQKVKGLARGGITAGHFIKGLKET
ncbi:MAG: Peptidase family U32 [Methanoregula sp. PtaU1.Bin051]|nr:MAG: Peptidase family U32 [Methanoregula sp. PtaU1.Bin051]